MFVGQQGHVGERALDAGGTRGRRKQHQGSSPGDVGSTAALNAVSFSFGSTFATSNMPRGQSLRRPLGVGGLRGLLSAPSSAMIQPISQGLSTTFQETPMRRNNPLIEWLFYSHTLSYRSS